MVIMLLTFVAIRQIYLFVMTRYITNTPFWVGFGYPIGWMCCFVIEVVYYIVKWGRREKRLQN